MRRSKLIPEVKELVRSGKLSAIDAEWIQNLPPDQQLASAEKCMKLDPEFIPLRDMQPQFRAKRDNKGKYSGSGNGTT